MIELVILAAVLVGPPQPTKTLFIGCHSESFAAKRIKTDLNQNEWFNAHYTIVYEDKDWMVPKFKTKKREPWREFPTVKEMPNGPFTTRGIAMYLLQSELEPEVKIKRDPMWIVYRDAEGFIHVYTAITFEIGRCLYTDLDYVYPAHSIVPNDLFETSRELVE